MIKFSILQVLLGSAKHLSVEHNSQIENDHVSLRNRLSEDLTTAHSIIGHFRITFGLFFKASPGAHLFI